MSDQDYNPKSVDATLSRVESKLDTALAAQLKHEERIASLERWKGWMLGAAAAIGFVLSWIREYIFGPHRI